MDILTNKFKRNPNEKVHSLFQGVAPGGGTLTTIVKASEDRQRLEATRVYTPGALQRGQSGRAAVLVLGGMETTLDEVQYILEAKQAKKFVPQRKAGEIAAMCRMLTVRRNEQIEAARKLVKGNPSLAPKKKRTVRLMLPVGYRYQPTGVPGLSITVKNK